MKTRMLPMAMSLLTAVVISRAEDRNWPRFRGPDGQGIGEAASLPAQWKETDYNWKVALPGLGHSSPVVWGKRIYVTAGDPRTAARFVLCLDVADGRTLWRQEHRSRAFRQHGDNSYATATPAADANGVIVTWSTPEEVVLLALDAEGREAWRSDLGPFVGIHGSGSSPVIVGDLVVLANEQADPKALPTVYAAPTAPKVAGKGFIVAVDRKTGRTRWQVPRRSSQAPYSTPCLYHPEGGQAELVFSSTSHGLTALDPATGKINWEMPGLFTERCVGSPAAAPGLVFAGDGYGTRGQRIVAVRPGSTAGGVQPALAYEIKRPVPLVPTPLVKDGRLVLWGDDGIVACLKAADGEVLWRQRVGGSFYGSPVWAAGRLYCIARNGEVVVLAAGDKYELLGRVPLGEPSQATPAIANGTMYLRTRSQLFSLGGK